MDLISSSAGNGAANSRAVVAVFHTLCYENNGKCIDHYNRFWTECFGALSTVNILLWRNRIGETPMKVF